MEDTELVNGIVFSGQAEGGGKQAACKQAQGPTRIENPKIGVIGFHLSNPKTDIDESIVVSDYLTMDRLMREERQHVLNMIKKIAATGCNVLIS